MRTYKEKLEEALRVLKQKGNSFMAAIVQKVLDELERKERPNWQLLVATRRRLNNLHARLCLHQI